MIASIVGTLGALGSAIGGSVMAKKQAQKAESELQAQRNYWNNWYNRRYNEDYLQTAEAQRALTKAYEQFQRQVAAVRGRQAVLGGTEESVASTMEAANRGLADTMSQIAAQGTARKDRIEDTYNTQQSRIADMYMNMYNNRANAVSQAAGNAAQGFTNFAMADLSSHLNTGKGIFGNQFKKGNTTANNNIRPVYTLNPTVLGYHL